MVAPEVEYSDSSLPSADSPDLILVPATPSERIECIKLNSIAWKGPLDTETYVARENHLFSQRLTKDGLTCWILVDAKEPEGQRTILSSCETYRKKAFVAHRGRVEDTVAHGVGSVYSRPEFRGKGYASRMIRELSRKLDSWQTENGRRNPFSVLFSDIGKRFYAQHGWKPFVSSHISLPPITKDEYERGLPGTSLPTARALLADDVHTNMCSDEIIRGERERLRAASENSPVAKVAIPPDFDHMVWHWAREEFYAEKMFPKRDPPVVKGAGEDRTRVYCAWNRNFGESPYTLYILRWVYDEPTSPEQEQETVDAMAAVLRRAQYEAHQWNIAKVEFWNPSPLLVRAAALVDPSVKIVHREKTSIASLKWNGAEQGLGDEVEWWWNEKYAWC